MHVGREPVFSSSDKPPGRTGNTDLVQRHPFVCVLLVPPLKTVNPSFFFAWSLEVWLNTLTESHPHMSHVFKTDEAE